MTERAEALDAAGSGARAELETVHAAREIVLASARAAIRECAVAVRSVQRHEFDAGRAHIAAAAEHVGRARDAAAEHPELRAAGLLHDAHKEYAEASIALAFVEGGPLPTASELGVGTAAYLNGLAEAASELRRQVLDLLRAGETERAEALFATMDEVYAVLVTIDYPDAITGGLRRTTDALRAVLERTRGDVTNASVVARFQVAVERTRHA